MVFFCDPRWSQWNAAEPDETAFPKCVHLTSYEMEPFAFADASCTEQMGFICMDVLPNDYSRLQ